MSRPAALALALALAVGCASPPADPAVGPPGLEEARARAEALEATGWARLARRDLPGARRAFHAAWCADPVFVRAHLGLARCHYEAGDLALEVAEYRKALALAPALVEAWVNLGHAHLALDQLAEARAAYRRALELGAHRPQVLFNLLRVERDLGHEVEARRLAEELGGQVRGAW